MPADEFQHMVGILTSYLNCDAQDPTEENPDMAALAMIAKEN